MVYPSPKEILQEIPSLSPGDARDVGDIAQYRSLGIHLFTGTRLKVDQKQQHSFLLIRMYPTDLQRHLRHGWTMLSQGQCSLKKESKSRIGSKCFFASSNSPPP